MIFLSLLEQKVVHYIRDERPKNRCTTSSVCVILIDIGLSVYICRISIVLLIDSFISMSIYSFDRIMTLIDFDTTIADFPPLSLVISFSFCAAGIPSVLFIHTNYYYLHLLLMIAKIIFHRINVSRIVYI